MMDIGHMTWGIRDNITDLCEIWNRNPGDRRKFGEREIRDLQAARLKLSLLLSAIEVDQLEPRLRLVEATQQTKEPA
jgi:hypothetical protein